MYIYIYTFRDHAYKTPLDLILSNKTYNYIFILLHAKNCLYIL